MKPKVIFMGEKPFGALCLKDLLKRDCKIIGICTRKKTDKIWWGEELVRSLADEHGIPIIKREEIINLKPDIIISVLYPYIIEQNILESANHCYNLHLAPLPEYKGCNCGSHALMRGDKKFGVTLHIMTKNLDSGDIIETRYFPLTIRDNAKSLYDKATKTAFEVWLSNIDGILKNKCKIHPFIDDGSKPFPRDSLDNKQIPKTLDKQAIYNFVRSLDFPPFEPAYFLDENYEKIHLKTDDFDEEHNLKNKNLFNKFKKYLELNQ